MSGTPKTIALIAEDDDVAAVVGRAFGNRTDMQLVSHTATLTKMNGAAVAMATENDVVLFKTEADIGVDVAAIAELREKLGKDAVLLALTDDTLSIADARKLTKAGVNDVLGYPLAEGELVEQIDRWTTPAAPVPALMSAQPRIGEVIAVVPARGGIGASSIAANLADRLRDVKGHMRKVPSKRVALVDLDMQFGSIASLIDVEPNDALYSLADSDMLPDATFLDQAMIEAAPNLFVLTAPRHFAPLDALDRVQVVTLLDQLRAQFDYIVVDLPRALVPWVAGVLERSDRMMLITDTTVPAVLQSRRLIDFFMQDVPTLNVEIVVNYERKPLIAARHHSEAVKVLERPLTHWVPADPKTMRQCIDRGELLSANSRRTPVAKAIAKIGGKILAVPVNRHASAAKSVA